MCDCHGCKDRDSFIPVFNVLLVQSKRKLIQITASSAQEARRLAKDHYQNWEISDVWTGPNEVKNP